MFDARPGWRDPIGFHLDGAVARRGSFFSVFSSNFFRFVLGACAQRTVGVQAWPIYAPSLSKAMMPAASPSCSPPCRRIAVRRRVQKITAWADRLITAVETLRGSFPFLMMGRIITKAFPRDEPLPFGM